MIPKVAHYSGHQSYGDVPVSSLKPGQSDMWSVPVYKESCKLIGSAYLKDTDNFGSVYGKNNDRRTPNEYIS